MPKSQRDHYTFVMPVHVLITYTSIRDDPILVAALRQSLDELWLASIFKPKI